MRRARAALVGIFVLGAACLIAAALVLWVTRRVEQGRYEYVSYFRGTASGLRVGSSVRLRGIKVGTITGFRMFSLDHPEHLVIGVYMAFDEEKVRALGAGDAPAPPMVAEAVRHGLRTRIGSTNPITGSRPIELDFDASSPIIAARPPDADDTPEIPLVAAPPDRAQEALDKLLTRLDEVDLPALSRAVTRAATRIGEASESIGRLAASIDEGLDGAIGLRAPWMVDLRRSLDSIDKAARELRGLAEYLRRNPSSLIMGKPKDGR